LQFVKADVLLALALLPRLMHKKITTEADRVLEAPLSLDLMEQGDDVEGCWKQGISTENCPFNETGR
jgi:hypothetical protein